MRNKGNPGKKYMTRDEYFHYIELMTAKDDIESVKLGISLFKTSETFKHYRYSPIMKFKGTKAKLLLCDTLQAFEYDIYNNRKVTLEWNYPELKRWMLKHTL